MKEFKVLITYKNKKEEITIVTGDIFHSMEMYERNREPLTWQIIHQ